MHCGEQLGLRCSACGTELPGGVSFCPNCGGVVEGASMAPPRVPRSYTPNHLVEKILTTRSALEGERKQVTVLFVDIKGSVALADQVDVEEWHGILDGFFRVLANGVHRFEGTINQYTGDGVMALFGAPISHEDHAQRGCHAALALREELRRYANDLRRQRGLNFSFRMGLNSGEVVVGKIGDDLRMDYTAKGQAVGLAARMEQIAEPGRIYVTEYTSTLVQGFFEFDDLGEFQLKGVKRPIRAFSLRGRGPLLSRFDLARERGLTRLVGRREELSALDAALEATIQGSGRIVGVVGEAGVGKSRLCHEFAEGCRSRGISVRAAHGVPYGKAIPFLPILELLRTIFGIGGRDSPPETRAKIAAHLIPSGPEFDEQLPLVFDFLGVPDRSRPAPSIDPEARQRQLLGMLRRQIRERSRLEPAVILFEDLHWLDPGSQGFLEQIVDTTVETRTLLLVNFRPGFHADWLQRPYCQQIALGSLSAEAGRELVRELLGDDPTVAALGDFVGERTAGNPFFIEELVRSFAESGALEGRRGAYRLVRPVEELAIPQTVQTLLAARIDPLPEPAKSVLHTAAVLGREFPQNLLARIVELPGNQLTAALSLLREAGFIYPISPAPYATYAFKHPLTQDVAYHSQLGTVRRHCHAQVAQVVAESESHNPETEALIGHHWERAGEPLQAAQAIARAARWSDRSDLSQSIRQWEKVRSLVIPLPESSEKDTLTLRACVRMLNFGWREGLSKREAGTFFAEARALARKQGDVGLEAWLHAAYGRTLGTIENADQYLRYALEAVRIAREAPDSGPEFVYRCTAGQALRHAGRFREALSLIEELLQRAEQEPDAESHRIGFSPYLWLLGMRAETLAWMGRLGDAERDLVQLTEAAREAHQIDLIHQARKAWVELHWIRGDAARALHDATQAVQIAEQRGSPYSVAMAYAALGLAHLMGREPGEAISAMERALAEARQHRVGLEFEASMLAHLAEAQILSGDRVRARDTAEQAGQVARARHARVLECQAAIALARALLLARGPQATDAAAAALARALALVAETGAQTLEPFIRLELGELARRRGDAEGCDAERRAARELFDAMGASQRARAIA
jgi:adenylate cyclase